MKKKQHKSNRTTHKRILHPKIVDAMHNQKLAKSFLVAGVLGLALGLFAKPSITGAAIVESPELSSTAFFSTLIIIVSFMMVWTGVMIYFMKVEVRPKL